MSLERFAAINAELDLRKRSREEVLKSAGVSLEAWEASQDFWLGRMAEEATRSRFALSQRYAALFAERRAALDPKKKRPSKPPSAPPTPRGEVAAPIPHAPQAFQNGAHGGAPVGAPPPPPPRPPVAARPAPPPPPPPPPKKYVARLSVDQLAALRAELAVAPESEHAATRLRFGLDDSTWVDEEAHWQKRFAEDKSLFQTYVKRFQYFRALLAPRT